MAYELGGKKKKTPWEMLLESYGVGVGAGARGGTGLLRSSGVSRALHLVGQTDIDDEGVGAGARLGDAALPWKASGPGAQATLLGESPVAAPAAKAPGMFTEGGVTYGEEALALPREERVALDPEEIARRRKAAFKPERSRYAAKRRKTLLGELGTEGYRRTILGAPSKMDVSWR